MDSYFYKIQMNQNKVFYLLELKPGKTVCLLCATPVPHALCAHSRFIEGRERELEEDETSLFLERRSDACAVARQDVNSLYKATEDAER